MFYLLFKFSFIIGIAPIIDSDNINLTRKGNEYKGFGVSFKLLKELKELNDLNGFNLQQELIMKNKSNIQLI